MFMLTSLLLSSLTNSASSLLSYLPFCPLDAFHALRREQRFELGRPRAVGRPPRRHRRRRAHRLCKHRRVHARVPHCRVGQRREA
eukprot:1281050-Pleurochrysis_carterae.AAC.1